MLLKALFGKELGELDKLVERGEAHMREICRKRGIDWDKLSDEEKEALVDEWLHEEERGVDD